METFSMSFLDIVSCGFGAIILLLVISKIAEPQIIETAAEELSARLQRLEHQNHELQGRRKILNRQLSERQQQLSETRQELARLQGELSSIEGSFEASRLEMETQTRIEKQLQLAQQRLSREQKRLQESPYRRPAEDAVIGGVPVDSEYIIFIIDTSGSMQRHAWPLVNRKVAEVLKVHPRIRGIQVLNDMGDYMFSKYAGKWIPDTPARRRAILKRLAGWAPFSNSSPVEGIEAAIRSFYADDKKISLYIFGDDFSRGSIESVVNTVSRLNGRDRGGRRWVRIHAIGFPVVLQYANDPITGVRFAALMRKLAENNGGSFVGLNDSR